MPETCRAIIADIAYKVDFGNVEILMQLKPKENRFLPVITATKLISSHNIIFITYLNGIHGTIFRCPFPDCSGHGYCSNVDGSCICDKVLSPKLY